MYKVAYDTSGDIDEAGVSFNRSSILVETTLKGLLYF